MASQKGNTVRTGLFRKGTFDLTFQPTNPGGTVPTTAAFFMMHCVDLIGVSTSHPLAFVVVAVYVALWLGFYSQSLNWQSVATVATWVTTLFIQRAEHREHPSDTR
jgi:hypothetical protein